MSWHIVALVLSLSGVGGEIVPSCGCAIPVPPCQAFWEAHVVFVGTARKIADIGQEERVTFDVSQVERGTVPATVDVESYKPPEVRCRFQVGERYVVYAYRSDGRLKNGACSRTAPVSRAEEDLAYFAELKAPGSGGRIYGSVRYQEPDVVAFGTQDRGPAPGVSIRLEGPSTRRELTTAEDGSYAFDRLLPGKYTLTLQPRTGMRLESHHVGVVQISGPTAFTVDLKASRGCVPIGFSYRGEGGIRGVLVDEKGTPVAWELVHVVAAANAGTSDRLPISSKRTGTDGAFEFTPLPSGDYVIGTSLDEPPGDAEFDRRVYLPGVRSTREARVITIEDSAMVDAGRFTLPADPVERTITGVVVLRDGAPAPDARVLVHGAVDEAVPVDEAGRFRVTLPYGSRFTVRAIVSRVADGRERSAESESTEIGHYDREREIRLVLGTLQ